MASKIDDFSNAVSRGSNGGLVVNLAGADLGGQPLTVITDGAVQLKVPAAEQVSAFAVVAASNMGSTGFDPAKQLISMGSAQLNRTGRGLGDVDSRVMVETAITPLSEVGIAGRDAMDLTCWLNVIKNIREIDERHGFHWNGKPVVGAPFFDHLEDGHSTIYGEARAELLRQAAAEALSTGQDQYVPLALMTPELIRGWAINGNSERKAVGCNLRDQAADLNLKIAAQLRHDTKGQIITKRDGAGAHWQFSVQENWRDQDYVYSVNLTAGGHYEVHRRDGHSSARPAALRVYAPKP